MVAVLAIQVYRNKKVAEISEKRDTSLGENIPTAMILPIKRMFYLDSLQRWRKKTPPHYIAEMEEEDPSILVPAVELEDENSLAPASTAKDRARRLILLQRSHHCMHCTEHSYNSTHAQRKQRYRMEG